VQKASSAEKAGLKVGDTFVEVDGKAVVSMAQVQHILGVKYAGDKISLKYKRGDQVNEIKSLELTGKNIVIAQPFLGILPMRDDPKLGVEIRHVYEGSAAEKAKLKPGDRIVKFGAADDKELTAFTGDKRGRNQFFDWLNTLHPGAEVKLDVKRKGADKAETIALTLGDQPGSLPGVASAVPDKLPQPATFKKSLEPLEINNPNIKPPKIGEQKKPMPETGLMEKNTGDGEGKYWLYVHEDYDPDVAHAVVVWLHPPDKNDKDEVEEFVKLWDDYCKDNHIILVMPIEKKGGWIPSAANHVVAATQETAKGYNVDRQRVVAHGLGIGGQMALYLGFNHRDVFRGVCAVGATATNLKDNVANQRLSIYLYSGEFDQVKASISDSRTRLAERRFPAFYREIPERGREYLEKRHIPEVVRWIDSLDQQ
jgi:predicted esterase